MRHTIADSQVSLNDVKLIITPAENVQSESGDNNSSSRNNSIILETENKSDHYVPTDTHESLGSIVPPHLSNKPQQFSDKVISRRRVDQPLPDEELCEIQAHRIIRQVSKTAHKPSTSEISNL